MHPIRINFSLYIRMKRYLPLLKMAEEIFSGYDAQSDIKRQKLLKCILTGNSKLYLGKVYTEDQLAKLSEEEAENPFNNYEAKLSGQMVHSLGGSVINMYSMGVCATLGISDQDALSEDLESDPFLNSALQRFTCEMYYRFGSFSAPLSVGIIMSRHYLSKRDKNGGKSGDNEGLQPLSGVETTKNLWGRALTQGCQGPLTSSKSEVIGSFIGVGIVGFCFGIGFMLAVKTVNNLEELIRR